MNSRDNKDPYSFQNVTSLSLLFFIYETRDVEWTKILQRLQKKRR